MPMNNLSVLTPRQLEIVSLMVRGQSTKEISHLLSIAPRTVKYHMAEARRRVGVDNRTQLIVVVAGCLSSASGGIVS
jgi:DNA-binding CsgD family transcriptional regulator